MSPFVLNVSVKHRHVTKHVRFPSSPDQIYVHQKRGEGDGESQAMRISEFINKYWIVLLASAAVVVILLVLLVVFLIKRFCLKNPTKNSVSEKAINEKKASDHITPIITHLGTRPESHTPGLSDNVTGSSPNIQVTPATASPTKPSFPSTIDDPFTYKSMNRKSVGIDPYFPPGSPVFQTPESDSDSISQEDIQTDQVHQPFRSGLRQLALYHDRDMSQDHLCLSPGRRSDPNLDEVDLRSPARTPMQEESVEPNASSNEFRNLPRSNLASRIAAMIGKMTSYASMTEEPIGHAREVQDDDTISEWTVTSTQDDHGLTEGELSSAMALQFPPPAPAGRAKAGLTRSPISGPAMSDETKNFQFSVPQFSFHHPTGFHMRQQRSPSPPIPNSRTNIATPTFGQDVSEQRTRSLPSRPPEGLRRPSELTRMASHQDMQNSSKTSVPFTSFTERERARARSMAQKRGGMDLSRNGSSGSRTGGSSMGRSRTLSDRYVTSNLAAQTVVSPRK